MKMSEVCMCFESGALRGPSIADLIRETVRFRPQEITARALKYNGRYIGETHLPMIASDSNLEEVYLEDGTASFTVTDISAWRFQAVYWSGPPELSPDPSMLHAVVSLPGFTAGYVYDPEDVRWQSEKSVSNYETFGRDHSAHPKRYDRDFNCLMIDTSLNPGRMDLFPRMWMMSAWQMWFGSFASAVLDQRRLEAFPDAAQVAFRSKSIFIQLYEDLFDTPEQTIRTAQRSFRQWVGMDDLLARKNDFIDWEPDSAIEIRHGSFSGGGVKQVLVWKDVAGSPTPRSKAAFLTQVIVDAAGREIFRKEQAVSAIRSGDGGGPDQF